jgi:hypothetical protein
MTKPGPRSQAEVQQILENGVPAPKEHKSHRADELMIDGVTTRLEATENERRALTREELDRHNQAMKAEFEEHRRRMYAINSKFAVRMYMT